LQTQIVSNIYLNHACYCRRKKRPSNKGGRKKTRWKKGKKTIWQKLATI